MQSIYQPAEDSYLLKETLKKFLKNKSKNINILDMGSGSGIQALNCKELGFKKILSVDINPEAVKHLKKLKLKTLKSNLFSNIPKSNKFDLIIFNPPYLPEDKREPIDLRRNTTAGKKGYEIILKFLTQAKPYLKKDASIILLFSSLSKPKKILSKAKKIDYNYELLNNQKLFFEELYVFKFSPK
ncbi:MAG: HemK2/MTQ2 family protein methyltransferase [archaeon]